MDDSCVFCKIVRKEHQVDSVVYEDDDYIAFHDIRPDAEIHIQLIPKKHIKNINVLSKDDVSMLENMKEIGENIVNQQLEEKSKIQLSPLSKFVFHVPPYNSIEHLHLHCMGGKFKFKSKITHGNIFPWVMPINKLINKLKS